MQGCDQIHMFNVMLPILKLIIILYIDRIDTNVGLREWAKRKERDEKALTSLVTKKWYLRKNKQLKNDKIYTVENHSFP